MDTTYLGGTKLDIHGKYRLINLNISSKFIFELLFVKAFGRIPSRHPGYCDQKSRGSAAAMIFNPAEGRTFLRTLRNLKACV